MKEKCNKRTLLAIWKSRYIYLLLLPGIVYIVVFKYAPMYGIQLAWKDFLASKGIWGSEFIGGNNFTALFQDGQFWIALRNTFIIGVMQTLISFPFAIILAILINEIAKNRVRRTLQVIITFPHFLSWVIVTSVVFNLLGNTGIINNLMQAFGGERVNFLANKGMFRWLLVLTYMWKESGWNAILYTAAIASINPNLYESAKIDGASKWQKILYITLPSISRVVMILFALHVGTIFDSGYSQVLNMYNPSVFETGDILDTYVYRMTFQRVSNYGLSTAAGLIKGLANAALLLLVALLARKVLRESLMGGDEISEKTK